MATAMSRLPWTIVGALAALFGLAQAGAACTIPGAPSQVLLYQDARVAVVAAPSAAISLDLSGNYPPPPGKRAPYVYPTNFHPALPGSSSGPSGSDVPLHVRVCPAGLGATAVWNLQLSIDDLIDPATNARIPASELAYRRRLLSAWTAGSNVPTIVYTGQGSAPVDLYFYFEARLTGAEAAGAYQGTVHFSVLASP